MDIFLTLPSLSGFPTKNKYFIEKTKAITGEYFLEILTGSSLLFKHAILQLNSCMFLKIFVISLGETVFKGNYETLFCCILQVKMLFQTLLRTIKIVIDLEKVGWLNKKNKTSKTLFNFKNNGTKSK